MNLKWLNTKLFIGISLITILVMSFGCEKEELDYVEFRVIVYGKGIDCGDLFLLDFLDNIDVLYQITVQEGWQTCYAYNLKEEFKVQGKELLVKIRKPTKDELFACTCLGLGYPWVTIVSAKEFINE